MGPRGERPEHRLPVAPVRRPAHLERREAGVAEAGPRLPQRQGGPVGQVAVGRRAVADDVPPRDARQRLLAGQRPEPRSPVLEQRVGVVPAPDPAADQPLGLGVAQHVAQGHPRHRGPGARQALGQLGARQVARAAVGPLPRTGSARRRPRRSGRPRSRCRPTWADRRHSRCMRSRPRSSSHPRSAGRTKCHVGRRTCVRTMSSSSARSTVARSAPHRVPIAQDACPCVLGLHPQQVVDHRRRVGLPRTRQPQVVQPPARQLLGGQRRHAAIVPPRLAHWKGAPRLPRPGPPTRGAGRARAGGRRDPRGRRRAHRPRPRRGRARSSQDERGPVLLVSGYGGDLDALAPLASAVEESRPRRGRRTRGR